MNIEDVKLNLIDTLNLLIIYNKNEDLIKCNIKDLEGDCYTFLHEKNLKLLLNQSYLSKDLYSSIIDLRTNILKVDKKFWNYEYFINGSEWMLLRDKTVLILDKLKLDVAFYDKNQIKI